MKSLLVGIDGSLGAIRALKFTAELASKCGVAISLLTVVARPSEAVITEMRRVEDVSLDEMAIETGRDHQRHAREVAFKSAAAPVIGHDVAMGDPLTLILAAAERIQPDMIVVGKRGHSQLKGVVMGSVSQALVSRAAFPVLVVP